MTVSFNLVLIVCLQAYYYSAIVEDVLLRFSWTLTITLNTVVRFHGMGDILATVLAPMEVFRYLRPLTCLQHLALTSMQQSHCRSEKLSHAVNALVVPFTDSSNPQFPLPLREASRVRLLLLPYTCTPESLERVDSFP